MSSKIAVHSRSKARFVEKAIELKESGKAKTSWPRLLAESGLTVNALHALFSPVTELARGYTVMDKNHVKKLERALDVAEGTLLGLVEGKAKDPRDFA